MTSGLNEFHEKRFIGLLTALVKLLRQHNIEKWATWFEGDLTDYLDGQGPPRQINRQQAVMQHVLMAFGGMSDFTRLQLTDETGQPLPDENEQLQRMSQHLWAATRSMQGYLTSIDTE